MEISPSIARPSPPKSSSSALSLKYQAEREVIQSKLGSIEEIQRQLGLSQRKMAQLLMVDPSSWNKWTKTNKAPAYIYRSLQWYLALIEKHPEWHPQNSFLANNDSRIYQLEKKLSTRVQELENNNSQLEIQLKNQIRTLKLIKYIGFFLFLVFTGSILLIF